MAVQLAAIFIILIAIVINSTNSYTKLEELNQDAVEVFFAMENEEAADKEKRSQTADGMEETGKETEETSAEQQKKPEGTGRAAKRRRQSRANRLLPETLRNTIK